MNSSAHRGDIVDRNTVWERRELYAPRAQDQAKRGTKTDAHCRYERTREASGAKKNSRRTEHPQEIDDACTGFPQKPNRKASQVDLCGRPTSSGRLEGERCRRLTDSLTARRLETS
jgi:hypothetical protein